MSRSFNFLHRFRGSLTLGCVAGALLGCPSVSLSQSKPVEQKATSIDTPIEDWLTQRVTELRTENKLVGFAAMVMRGDEVVGSAADGMQKKGGDASVTVLDLWHVGSITKSMTATMIARLIEQGHLDWTTTVEQCFTEKDGEIHERWQAVTLHQLLTHTSGAKPNFPVLTNLRHPQEGDDRLRERRQAVMKILAVPPDKNPGESFQYSNVGYTIAGAMAEARMNKSWEDLMRAEVFVPLNIASAGFGPPKDDDEKTQPQGHQKVGVWKRPVGQDADNSPIMGPAGIVHLSLRDLCRFGREHLRGNRGTSSFLARSGFKKLHEPILDDYACGWVAPQKNRWVDGPISWHNGSNTMWYALLVLLPEQDMVVSVVSNDGSVADAQPAAFQLVSEVSDRFTQGAEVDSP